MDITQYPLTAGNFIEEETKKVSIVFHHTASSGDAKKVIDNWNI